MDKKDTLHIIQTLASGIDPTTGEVFPPDSPYQNIDIVRALFHAARIIEESKELPQNAGTPWTEDEHIKVINDYKNGVTISQIAKDHQRTTGAIRSRLRKAGIIEK